MKTAISRLSCPIQAPSHNVARRVMAYLLVYRQPIKILKSHNNLPLILHIYQDSDKLFFPPISGVNTFL